MTEAEDALLYGHPRFRQCRQVILVPLPRSLRISQFGIQLGGQIRNDLVQITVVGVGIYGCRSGGIDTAVLARDALL